MLLFRYHLQFIPLFKTYFVCTNKLSLIVSTNQPVLVSATNVQHIGRMNSELDYFEKIQADKDRVDLLGPDSGDDGKPKGVFNVRSEVLALPKGQSDFDMVSKNAAHFYVSLPAYNGEHPSTPVCSTAVFDLPVSDNGKPAVQEHWIKMQQMTPTRNCASENSRKKKN